MQTFEIKRGHGKTLEDGGLKNMMSGKGGTGGAGGPKAPGGAPGGFDPAVVSNLLNPKK